MSERIAAATRAGLAVLIVLHCIEDCLERVYLVHLGVDILIAAGNVAQPFCCEVLQQRNVPVLGAIGLGSNGRLLVGKRTHV